MIYLIADSGSTKTQWCIIHQGGSPEEYYTTGINPVYLSEADILNLLEQEFPDGYTDVGKIWFYGAGCAFPEKNACVRSALTSFFRCKEVEIASDLMGAARALCGHHPGIVGILGTGSNSCYYDGEKIIENVSPLGFILGDEGSGADLGKRLVAGLLKGILPSGLKELFFAETKTSYAGIIERVYRQPLPNRYLADFTSFIRRHIDRPEVEQIVLDAFDAYICRNIMQYRHVSDLQLSFTGSIACIFRTQLELQLKKYGLKAGVFMQTPMAGLKKYHSEEMDL